MEAITFRGFSFKSKILLTFISAILLPIVIVQTVTHYNSTQSMTQKIDQLINANLQQTAKNIETTLLAYKDVVVQIFSDDQVNEYVQKINAGSPDAPRMTSELRAILSSYAYAKDGIRSVAIFTPDGKVICFDKSTGSNIDNVWSGISNIADLPLYKDAVAMSVGMKITQPQLSDRINGKNQYLFHLAQKLSRYPLGQTEELGVIVVSVHEKVLHNASNFTVPATGTSKPVANINFLIDRDYNVISYPVEEFIGYTLETVEAASDDEEPRYNYTALLKQSGMLNSEAIMVNHYSERLNDWTLVNVIDRQAMFKEMWDMQRINLSSGILALVVSVMLILYFTGNISRSISRIVSAMRVAQRGQLSIQINETSKDEFSIISGSFNILMNRINQLMIETREATTKQKEAEIRALEAQINPHFLYNTLDSINWMAIEKDEHDISRMLKNLAEILRYSVSNSNKLVSVKEEIKWLKQYISLQKNRFDDSFDCYVEADRSVLDFPIPKLLLQPFVENSIIHGIAAYESGGVLNIQFTREDNVLNIVIADNGRGIEPENIVKFQSSQQQPYHENPIRSDKGSGIGIRNVIDRLGGYYGSKASLQIDSVRGQGTKVLIVIQIGDQKGDSK